MTAFRLTVVFLALLATVSCVNQRGPEKGEATETPRTEERGTEEAFTPAENLSKRVVLYRLALQEGDLAPFMASPQSLEGLNVPPVAVSINKSWWSYEWDETRLGSLTGSQLTSLEDDVFPLIAPRIDESDEEKSWCVVTLGFDPDRIKPYIANAHTEWIPEQRELYLQGTEPGCLQVWCAKVQGEWKVVAFLPCIDTVQRPVPPSPPPSSVVPSSAGEDEHLSAGQGE